MTMKEYREASLPEQIQQLEAWIADPNVKRIKPALKRALAKLQHKQTMNTNEQPESFEESEAAQAVHQKERESYYGDDGTEYPLKSLDETTNRTATQEALSEVNQLTDEQLKECMERMKKPLPYPTLIQAGEAALTAKQALENSLKKDPVYPFMEKIMKLSQYCEGGYMKELFPNTIFERGGLARMHSCIGFLRGMAAAGKVEEAERMAQTLFRSFSLGSNDDRVDWASIHPDRPLMAPPAHMHPQGNKLVVTDDGSFLSFSFLYVGIMGDQSVKNGTWEFPGFNERDIKYRYGKVFNGGIIFHGLDQNYTVRIGGGSAGWSMHT